MNSKIVRVLSCAAVLAVAACDDSATDVLGDLTEAEAEALAEVVGATVLNGAMGSQNTGAATGPQAVVQTYSETVSGTFPCELGGSVGVDGTLNATMDDQTGAGTIDFALTQVHDGCVAESQDGIRFTLDGAPSVSAVLAMEFSEQAGTLAFGGSYTGAVDWATDGRDGTCSIDVEFTADLDGAMETGSASMSGTVCGVSFSKSLTIS